MVLTLDKIPLWKSFLSPTMFYVKLGITLFCALTSAWCLSNISTTAVCPLWLARRRGVAPFCREKKIPHDVDSDWAILSFRPWNSSLACMSNSTTAISMFDLKFTSQYKDIQFVYQLSSVRSHRIVHLRSCRQRGYECAAIHIQLDTCLGIGIGMFALHILFMSWNETTCIHSLFTILKYIEHDSPW